MPRVVWGFGVWGFRVEGLEFEAVGLGFKLYVEFRVFLVFRRLVSCHVIVGSRI